MSSSQAPVGGGAMAAAVSCTHCCSLKFTNPIPPLFSSHRRRPKFKSSSISNNVHKPLTVASAEPTSQTTIASSTSSPSAANSSGSNLDAESNNSPITLKGQGDVPLEGVIQYEKPSSSTSDLISKWGRVALLSGGDVLALILFSTIGRFSHGFIVFDVETLKTADPFIAGWFLGAYFLGGFGKDGRGMNGRNKAIVTAAKSWALGIPLGIIIRSIALGHIPATNFVVVTMGSTAVLLIGWRALVSSIIAEEKSTKDDAYRQGSPFELFELLTSLVRRW